MRREHSRSISARIASFVQCIQANAFNLLDLVERFHHKRQGRACWRGALPARCRTAPPAGDAPRACLRAAPRALAWQVLQILPTAYPVASCCNLLLDIYNNNWLQNKMEEAQNQVGAVAAPSPNAAIATYDVAAERAAVNASHAAAECLSPHAATAALPLLPSCLVCC